MGAVVTVVLMLLLTVALIVGSIYHTCKLQQRQSTTLVRAWHVLTA